MRKMHQVYDPALERAMDRPRIVAVIVLIGAVAAGAAFTRIGQTFMPVMDEGTPVVSIRKYPTISVEEAAQTDMRIQRELMTQIPEIRRIMARAGADELGIDPAGLNETDMFMTLAPKKEWRGKGTPWLIEEMRKVLDDIPGISYAFAQPIDMRVQEMIIGARGDVVVKVFGDEIDTLNRVARDVAAAIRKIPGATDVFTLRNAGLKYFTVKVDRDKAGRLGLNATDIQDALRVWVDGRQLGIVLEGIVRTPLFIRGEERLRASPEDLMRVPIVRSNGGTVELSQVADIQIEDGPDPDHPRGRSTLRHRSGQRARPGSGRLRRRGEGGGRRRGQTHAGRRFIRSTFPDLGRPVRKPATRLGAARDRCADCARPDLPVALFDVRLAAAGDSRILQRAICHDRRHHRAVGIGRISLGTRIRRIHCVDRHRRAERRRDGLLHQRSRHQGTAAVPRSRHGRRTTAAPSCDVDGDDCRLRSCRRSCSQAAPVRKSRSHWQSL